MNNIIRRVIERACALLPLQCVPGLIFRASVLRPSRCVREKYGAGDEARSAVSLQRGASVELAS